MSATNLTDNHHCIGFLESSSIAKGIEAVDVMMKMAEVELLLTTIIPRGKYLIMIGGNVADVESSLRAGLQTAAGTGPGHFLVPNVPTQLFPGPRGRRKADPLPALGLIA